MRDWILSEVKDSPYGLDEVFDYDREAHVARKYDKI